MLTERVNPAQGRSFAKAFILDTAFGTLILSTQRVGLLVIVPHSDCT